MKYFLSFLLYITTLFTSYAQLSNKHWLPPLHANEENYSTLIQGHYVYLSTPEPTPFAVTVTTGDGTPINGSPFTISQGNPVQINIGNAQPSVMMLDRTDVGTVITGKGLVLEAQYDFYVNFRVRSQNHAEFLTSKGKIGAGTVFRLGSLPQTSSGGIRNFVASFMATEDATSVTLSDYDSNVVFINGNSTFSTANQSFTLNAGESVVVSGYTTTAANYTGFVGALLTSNKPIVANTGNLAGGMLLAMDGQDFNLDQIVPLEQVGTEYIVMKGNGSNVSERPMVIAHQDATDIFVNGNATPITTINAGEYYLIPSSYFLGTTSNKNMYITTSKKVFVYQIIAGSLSDATTGMFFIPPVNCFWQQNVDLIPDFNKIGTTVYSNSVLLLATKTGATVQVNGITTTATPLPVTGVADWETYRITNLSGNVSVTSTEPLSVGVLGAENVAGYGGFFSGFGSIPTDSKAIICSSETTVDLFTYINGNPETGGTWSFNGTTLANGLFNPTTDTPGIYTYAFSKSCDGVTQNYAVSIEVSIQQAENVGSSTTKTYCNNDNPEDLITLLGNNVATNGIWSFDGTTLANGLFNPATDASGIYTYTLPASGVCPEITSTVTVTVNNAPQITTISNLEECDDTSDGDAFNNFTFFNLNDKENEIIGTQTNIASITYHEQQNYAENNSNSLPLNYYTTSKTIYFRITTTDNCYSIGSFNLVVNPLPNAVDEVTLKQCDTDSDAITSFNLTEANSLLSTATTVSFSYFSSIANATTNTSPITNTTNYIANNGTIVWARIEDTTTHCFVTAKVNLVVSAMLINANYSYTINECDNYVDTTNTDTDGIAVFNLTEIATDIMANSTIPTGQAYSFSYYLSENDALAETSEITGTTDFSNTIPYFQKIWVRIDSEINNECVGLNDYLTLTVTPTPDVNLGDDFSLCVSPSTGLGEQTVNATPISSGNYSYQWSSNVPNLDLSSATNATYTITQAGTYTVEVTNTATNCSNTDEITAIISSEPEQFIATVTTPAFSSGLTIIETNAIGGFGTYEYSLDLIDWQTNPTFTDLPNGTYTVYVRDIQGCGVLSVDNLFAITYPNFFTPNGDGYNDVWKIDYLPQSFNPIIYIFDRYGKLLQQQTISSEGWDGTFNGQPLPSSDYWFVIEYTENNSRKQFKSHFSLKR